MFASGIQHCYARYRWNASLDLCTIKRFLRAPYVNLFHAFQRAGTHFQEAAVLSRQYASGIERLFPIYLGVANEEEKLLRLLHSFETDLDRHASDAKSFSEVVRRRSAAFQGVEDDVAQFYDDSCAVRLTVAEVEEIFLSATLLGLSLGLARADWIERLYDGQATEPVSIMGPYSGPPPAPIEQYAATLDSTFGEYAKTRFPDETSKLMGR